MKNLKITILYFLVFAVSSYGQTIQDIINQVNLDALVLTVNEFSGEQSVVINGITETITNRQQANNNLAADYLVQRFNQLDNITVNPQQFDGNGRNIIATQLGKTNPNNIYIICGHYDTVADYCADDNASGTATILEIARILSTQCLDNTIVYALWDEEENGLNGSRAYAIEAVTNNDNILGVLNIDMMAYDGDGDKSVDIDIHQNDAASLAMSNDIVSVFNTYTFDLNINIVDPGTELSDHSSFWNRGFPAVLVGEAWSEGDENNEYHSIDDRISNFNLPYYHETAKLIMGYMVTKVGLIAVDNTVTQTVTTLTSNDVNGSYQWIDCNTNTEIPGAIGQSFVPTVNGNYAVKVTSGTCTERSECVVFDTLNLDVFSETEISMYPNPVKNKLNIETSFEANFSYNLYDLSGKLILKQQSDKKKTSLDLKHLTKGVYFLNISTSHKSRTYKVIKE